MKAVKKTSEYTIFQRRDNRYAVVDKKKRAINGDQKVEILLKEGLVKKMAAAPKPAAEEATEAEQTAADDAE